ncbi:hypothetical protein SDRG_12738 [Saprolegnia diclina VS20]|uniref:PH domain-containing protein n=1 Tax=Saprolegnia diclina (strain VS20) TaxID=1156394 RepID=T0Q7R6_SAPDV|nr:hypothetical protein SDRG_12738 [Saprolegnia diclina VS20]EQC29490.1 hypothetical protein SDRG_12738 [Saprolegnia diclina VS20]|eukprot:XP_008617042.1 hypothetical protein SDRG_12738 [Saprolegnia diclina VS20]
MPRLADDDKDVETTLKRKVKNERTNLFEWVKYKCLLHGPDLLLDPCDLDDALPATYRIALDKVHSVQTKAGSRFEIAHTTASHGSRVREEFMAPTPQHCSRWVASLQAKVLRAQADVAETPAMTRSMATLSASPAMAHARRHERMQVASTTPLDLDKLDGMLSVIEATSPKLAKSWGSVRPASTKSIPDDEPPKQPTLHHEVDEQLKPTLHHEGNETPLARRWTASEHDASEQLDILVRVETALKQLELDNKAALSRETELRQELANAHDAMRLASAETQELATQLREVATERDEWKLVARQKQDEVTQLRDELQIAKDEVRLLTNEQLRLAHRNRDLAVHVQRLDTLVYGKF